MFARMHVFTMVLPCPVCILWMHLMTVTVAVQRRQQKPALLALSAGSCEENHERAEQDAADRPQLPRHHQARRMQDWHYAGEWRNYKVNVLSMTAAAMS